MKRLGLLFLAATVSLPAAASQNHISNAHFNSGLSVWTTPSPSGYTRIWTGSLGHDALGAVSITSDGSQTLTATVLTQCVGASTGVTYSLGEWFRYSSGFGGAATSSAQVYFFSGSSCDGSALGSELTATTSDHNNLSDKFQHVTVDTVAPAGTLSALVRISVYAGLFTA
jgi:hypothetical protein